jgi:hypothetical protein
MSTFDGALLMELVQMRMESPRFSSTPAGLAIENAALQAMRSQIMEDEDLWEVLDDVLALASVVAATLTLSRHGARICRPCMASVLLSFSEHVNAELDAYEAVNEPDEPPFSGSIN